MGTTYTTLRGAGDPVVSLYLDVENDWIASSPTSSLCDVVYVASRMRRLVSARVASGACERGSGMGASGRGSPHRPH